MSTGVTPATTGAPGEGATPARPKFKPTIPGARPIVVKTEPKEIVTDAGGGSERKSRGNPERSKHNQNTRGRGRGVSGERRGTEMGTVSFVGTGGGRPLGSRMAGIVGSGAGQSGNRIGNTSNNNRGGMSVTPKKEGEVAGKQRPRIEGFDNKYAPTRIPFPKEPFPEEFNDDPFMDYEDNTSNDQDDKPLLRLFAEHEEQDGRVQDKIFFMQLPNILPRKPEAGIETNAFAGASAGVNQWGGGGDTEAEDVPLGPNPLTALSPGYVGKLVLYRSGKVMMKLGENQFEVLPGMECSGAQIILGVPTTGEDCHFFGEVSGRVVVMPSLEDLL